VPELQRLHADHAPAVLAFELANRTYFAAFISDRGDEFFDVGPADPAHIGGKPGTWYQRDLTTGDAHH
jgi:hypothetical protein